MRIEQNGENNNDPTDILYRYESQKNMQLKSKMVAAPPSESNTANSQAGYDTTGDRRQETLGRFDFTKEQSTADKIDKDVYGAGMTPNNESPMESPNTTQFGEPNQDVSNVNVNADLGPNADDSSTVYGN